MKISTIIKILQDSLDEEGDIEVDLNVVAWTDNPLYSEVVNNILILDNVNSS